MQTGLRICNLIGALAPGSRPLEGKSFYLDQVKSRLSTILTELIGHLGGKVEGFLNKDVSVVVTGNREAIPARPAEMSQAALRKARGEGDGSPVLQKVVTAQRPGTPRPPVCGSRGKALLEKAIRSQDKSRGSVLSNASSWGVKIVSVDEFLKLVDRLHAEISSLRSRRSEKKARQPSGPRVVKAGVLKADFVKVEDSSRKYRPLHVQSLTFPTLSYSGRFSPFETPAPAKPQSRRDAQPSQDTISRKSGECVSNGGKTPPALPHTASRWKNTGYCECCQSNYQHLDQHLESELHRGFVLDVSNYVVVDQMVAAMDADFVCCADSPDDTLSVRMSHGSPAPLNPCAEVGDMISHETDGDLTVVNHGSDHLSSPGAVDLVSDFGLLSNPPPQPVEPNMDVLPRAPVEAERTDAHLPSVPHPQILVPNPSLEDGDLGTVSDDTPLARAPSPVSCPVRVGSDGFVPSTAKDLVVVVGECPSLVPSHQSTLDTHKGASGCSHTSDTEQAGPLRGAEPERLTPLDIRLMESDQSTGRLLASVASRLSFSPSCVNRRVRVNSRKRSRSFPQSPSPPRKARKCSGPRSDPTNENSVVHDHTAYIRAGPPLIADNRNDSVKSKPDTLLQELSDHLFPEQFSAFISVAARNDCLPLQHDAQHDRATRDESVPQGDRVARDNRVVRPHPCAMPRLEPDIAVAATTTDPGVSSELGPPELYPFYRDDDLRQQLPPFCDPPTLLPSFAPPPPPEDPAHSAASQAPPTSLLSQSFPFCLESALVPNFTSSTSSESDWDSGLLAWLAPAVHLQPSGGHCELDVSLLLQRSCVGVQDGSYASRLCSILQPAVPSPTRFRERMSPNALYRPIKTTDMRIIQSLGM